MWTQIYLAAHWTEPFTAVKVGACIFRTPSPLLPAVSLPLVRLSHFSPQAVSPEERFWNASGAAFVTVQELEQVAGALVAEIVLTTLLTLAVCMGAINEKTQGPLAPFSIGFSVTVDILAG